MANLFIRHRGGCAHLPNRHLFQLSWGRRSRLRAWGLEHPLDICLPGRSCYRHYGIMHQHCDCGDIAGPRFSSFPHRLGRQLGGILFHIIYALSTSQIALVSVRSKHACKPQFHYSNAEQSGGGSSAALRASPKTFAQLVAPLTMISDLQTLSASLSNLDPEADDFDLQADQLVMSIDPLLGDTICQPIFQFFESNPLSYAGAPGAFVHYVETFYPAYVSALIQSVRQRPSLNTILMMNRILNSSDCTAPLRGELLAVLSSTAEDQSWDSDLTELASKYHARHTPV